MTAVHKTKTDNTHVLPTDAQRSQTDSLIVSNVYSRRPASTLLMVSDSTFDREAWLHHPKMRGCSVARRRSTKRKVYIETGAGKVETERHLLNYADNLDSTSCKEQCFRLVLRCLATRSQKLLRNPTTKDNSIVVVAPPLNKNLRTASKAGGTTSLREVVLNEIYDSERCVRGIVWMFTRE